MNIKLTELPSYLKNKEQSTQTIKMKCCCGAEFEWPYIEREMPINPNVGIYTDLRWLIEQRADAWIELHKLCPVYKRKKEGAVKIDDSGDIDPVFNSQNTSTHLVLSSYDGTVKCIDKTEGSLRDSVTRVEVKTKGGWTDIITLNGGLTPPEIGDNVRVTVDMQIS